MAARGGGVCVWSEFVARSEIINLIRRRSRLPFSYLLLTIEGRRRREERETKTKEKSYFHSNATLLISGVSFGAHLYIVYSQVLGQCTHARSEQKNRKYSIAEGSFFTSSQWGRRRDSLGSPNGEGRRRRGITD